MKKHNSRGLSRLFNSEANWQWGTNNFGSTPLRTKLGTWMVGDCSNSRISCLILYWWEHQCRGKAGIGGNNCVKSHSSRTNRLRTLSRPQSGMSWASDRKTYLWRSVIRQQVLWMYMVGDIFWIVDHVCQCRYYELWLNNWCKLQLIPILKPPDLRGIAMLWKGLEVMLGSQQTGTMTESYSDLEKPSHAKKHIKNTLNIF